MELWMSRWVLNCFRRNSRASKFEPRMQHMRPEGLVAKIIMFNGSIIQIFSNSLLSLPFINKNPARISSRATSAETYLGKTLSIFVSSKNSPAQMIHFRGYFSVKFDRFIRESKGWLCGLAFIVSTYAVWFASTWITTKLNSWIFPAEKHTCSMAYWWWFDVFLIWWYKNNHKITWWVDIMISWYDDIIIWSCDNMVTQWSFDVLMIGSYDHMIAWWFDFGMMIWLEDMNTNLIIWWLIW